VNRKQTLDDLSLLTGATIIDEDLGDDLDLIKIEHLGSCSKSITTQEETIIQVSKQSKDVKKVIKSIKDKLLQKNTANEVVKLEKRLAMLAAKIAIVKIGANSDIELKEKQDRVEDAISSLKIESKNEGEKVLLQATMSPYKTILSNAGYEQITISGEDGYGIDVVTGNMVHMINDGIIDPLLVTKSALQNAASVASTILSTDCVINNIRINEELPKLKVVYF